MIFSHTPLSLTYGELVCETLSSGRTYTTPEGKKYPSITTILSILSAGDIQAWRQRVGKQEADAVGRRAAGRGAKVHDISEKFLKNKPIGEASDHMPNAWSGFKSIKPLLEKNVTDIMLQEKPLYSNHLGVAGRVDLVAKWAGRNSIIDIKTSARVKTRDMITSYFMQEAAYAIMVEERTGVPIDQLVTVMAVDFNPPIVFIERRDDWTEELIATIKEYNQQKLFGFVK